MNTTLYTRITIELATLVRFAHSLRSLIAHMLSFLKKQLRKWHAHQLDFDLGPHMWKKVKLTQISLKINAPNLRKDTNPSHPMCPAENLT